MRDGERDVAVVVLIVALGGLAVGSIVEGWIFWRRRRRRRRRRDAAGAVAS